MATDVDNIHILFDANQMGLLNFCLAFLLFGVALDLSLSDFNYILKSPKAVAVGLCSQLLVLPLLTILLILIINPIPSFALAMILLASCPGGNVSNYAVHLAKANTALSVVLTTISTIACAITTPLLFHYIVSLLQLRSDVSTSITIPIIDMVWTIFTLVLVPLTIGLLCTSLFPSLIQKCKTSIKIISMIIFVSFIVVAVYQNIDNLFLYIHKVFGIVAIHNGCALGFGYLFARIIFNLSCEDSKAISIETGIQNSGLALILIFNYFGGDGGMALMAAWWSIWHLISAFCLSIIWKKYT